MNEEDNVSIPEFLSSALDWDQQKIQLFLQPREMPKPFRTAELLDKWEDIIWFLNFLVRSLTSSVEEMASSLREKDVRNLEIVSSHLDRYLEICNTRRVRPSKLSTAEIQNIYSLNLSASTIAATYNISRRTVQKIKLKQIHSAILP